MMEKKTDTYDKIIFYDGVCLLCNRFIQFVLRADRRKEIYISPLQSDFASSILSKYQISTRELESVVFVNAGIIYTESDAALKIYTVLGFPWSIMGLFWIIPKVLRNGVYRWIARNRYKWFGKSEEVCELPKPEYQKRIIHSQNDH